MAVGQNLVTLSQVNGIDTPETWSSYGGCETHSPTAEYEKHTGPKG